MNKTKKKGKEKVANLNKKIGLYKKSKGKSKNKVYSLIKSRLNLACITYSYYSFLHVFRNGNHEFVSGFIAGDTPPEMEYSGFIGITEHIEIAKLEKNISGSKSLFVNPVVMVKVFEDNSITFNLKNKNKGANLYSLEMTEVIPEILEMLNFSRLTSSDLDDLLLDCFKQRWVFMCKVSQYLLNLKGIYPHNESHHLLNSSTVIDLPAGFLMDSFNFSMYSSFNSNSSIGYQQILSQNSWSAPESVPVLMNLSNISFLRASSLPTSDQFTYKNFSTFAFNSLFNDMVTLTIYNSPLLTNCSNFSSCLTFFSIPALITSDQFTSGILSNLPLSSFGTDNVNFAIFSSSVNKRNIVNKGNIVNIYKPFGFNENNLTGIMMTPKLK